MTKSNLTSINVILDSSGSMEPLRSDTIGNFNSFVKDQKDVPGEALFSLCTFNTDYNLIHDCVKIHDVPQLTKTAYKTQGSTALLDAMGHTIDEVGKKLAALPEEERPSRVVFLIITDGMENASHRYTASQIKSMVEHQKEKYSWDFIFLGANIDTITVGSSLGISSQDTLDYEASSAGTHRLYNTISNNLRSYRVSSTRTSFFDPDNNGSEQKK